MAGRTTAVLLLAFALAVVAVAPSYADDEVGLSLDGRHWSSQLSRPLFASQLRWVPGDVATRSFWVRNQGPTAASLRLAVSSRDGDRLLADGDVLIDSRVAGRPWVALRGDRTLASLDRRVLDQGARIRVDVRVRFDASSTNPTQLERLPLRFVVNLSQAAGAVDEDPGDHDAGQHGPGHHDTDHDGGLSGLLPDTGSPVTVGLLWLAAILLGGGAAIVLGARRRRDDEDERVHQAQPLCADAPAPSEMESQHV